MNETHETNRRYWDTTSEEWRRLRDEDGLLSKLLTEPELAFDGGLLSEIRDSVADLHGKNVCVVGSDDNYAAFALAGLGARVLSVDISQAQLDIAAARAAELCLDIEFVRADAAELEGVDDESSDLVVSTNGFFVWIADLTSVFCAVHRILRLDGHYVFYDIHPFSRPWDEPGAPLVMRKPYWDTGPFIGEDDAAVNFHWTIADLLNSIVSAGLSLVRLHESRSEHTRLGRSYRASKRDERPGDWRENALAGLPMWLTVNARKAG